MLFHRLGVSPEKSHCRSVRPRSSTQFAVVRLELLEDRFLLSGNPADGFSAAGTMPDRSLSALIDKRSPPSAAVLPANPQANASASQTPSDLKRNNGASGSGSGRASGPAVPGGPQNPGPWVYSPEEPFGLSDSAVGSLQGGGRGTGTSLPTPPPPSAVPAQNSSISLPSQFAAGVPASGIFKQSTVFSNSANISVLSLDPVAVDLSPPSPLLAVSSGFATAARGAQPNSYAVGPAMTTLRLGDAKTSLVPAHDRSQRSLATGTTSTRIRQRAELPDVAALAPVVTDSSMADSVGHVAAKASDDVITDGPAKTLQAVSRPALPMGPLRVVVHEAEPSESEREDEQMPANLAIYSAASLVVGVSAPGMTSQVRRDTRRSRARSGGGTRGCPA